MNNMRQTLRKSESIRRFLFISAICLSVAPKVQSSDLDLPDLGHSFSNIITPSQEYHLGQRWLRMFRAQVPTSDDPFVVQYTESLIQKLAVHSDVKDTRISVVVVQNSSLNAFAVPGGVVGVHTGLFKYAQNEQQFAAVLAHELAHLSQRHFARGVEEQRHNSILTLAGLFASILIAASSSGDQGIAAISATQALSVDARLRFSRSMEQEADRVGLQTMVRANMNPQAMPEMFEQMLLASQFSRRPPEFLLTHPVTESRIADSQGRARKYPLRHYEMSEEYQLVKVRLLFSDSKNTTKLENQFRDERAGTKFTQNAADYGLALALTANMKLAEARRVLKPLLHAAPNNLYFLSALADTYTAEKNYAQAEDIYQSALKNTPDSHPINVKLAELLMLSGKHHQCAKLLNAHVKRRGKDDYVWYLLAEVEGLRGNLLGVHLARAEYFSLNGIFGKAKLQLEHALKTIGSDDPYTRAKVEQRLREVKRMERETLS